MILFFGLNRVLVNFHLSSSSCHFSLAIPLLPSLVSHLSRPLSVFCRLYLLLSFFSIFCCLSFLFLSFVFLSSLYVVYVASLCCVCCFSMLCMLLFYVLYVASLCSVCHFSMLCMSLYYSDRLSSSSSFRPSL